VGLLISDAAGRITYANRAAKRLLQYNGTDLATNSIALTSVCAQLTDPLAALASGTISADSTEPFEALCITRDGSPIEVLVGVAFLNPDASPDKRQLAAFIADLTMQKKSEEVLRRTEKLAIVGRLAASIAHEINNPLEATINCLYLVSQTELSDVARQFLEMAQKELDRVTQITVQTLRFYRSSTKPTQTDVHELIGTVLSLLDSRIRHQRIEVKQQFRADPMIFAHDGEIRQVLANLIGNAIDAVSEGGCIVVRTQSARDWKHDRRGVAITIADDGMGMDSATSARVFEPFFSTKGMTGTGLGLWVSHEIAVKHQGRIRLRSRQAVNDKSSGSVFRLFLPALEEGA
jgi:signal transduction histidine kinase